MAPSLEQLDAYLAANSYLGSDTCATLEDYKCCKEIKSAPDAKKLPNAARWYAHISHLAETYPTSDWRGDPVPAGKAPNLGGGAAPAKQAAPKKEAAPKKDAAPKKESKREEKKKGGDKKEEEPKELTPEELAELKAKKLKKVKKEGGKRGVEIEGAADMGGLQFFCTSVDEPEGDLELAEICMRAMNEKSDPSEEERKGGSGHIGKTIFSAGVDQLAVVAYVPPEKQAECSCEEWLAATLKIFQGQIVTKGKDICTGFVKADGNKGIFPLKIREPMILEANNFLRSKGLFPEDNGDDSDEMVFGDDDFPSM